jgi:hypothetical protein
MQLLKIDKISFMVYHICSISSIKCSFFITLWLPFATHSYALGIEYKDYIVKCFKCVQYTFNKATNICIYLLDICTYQIHNLILLL